MSTAEAGAGAVAAAERGRTIVADRVVRRIAERAAAEALPPGDVGAISAKVATGGGRAELAIDLTLPYRAALGRAGDQVHHYVARRTAMLTGLKVFPARIRVHGLTLRVEPGSGAATPVVSSPIQDMSGRPPKRIWSERCLPATLAAILGAAVCGAALYEVVSVHVAGDAPLSLWSRLLSWLSTHGPGDSTLALGAVTLLLGLELILLALTPGRRRSLTMRTPDRHMRAALNRATAESLVRHAVADVSGISHARVRVRGHRARVRATVGFGDRDTAHEAVTTAAHEALATCGLKHTPRLRVSLRTAAGWQPVEPQDSSPQSPTTEGE
ncbi:DUF6286 domain-containing protein [Streptomyces sp. NPDC007205]|uniref:DUF6286 domain-containing protein n=1 Tax=Streptomyces sp. NPDC007205 TaxID=3154316 RepID=UPI0033DB2658